MTVADGCLCHLRYQRLRIAQQDVQHFPVSVEFQLEPLPGQSISGSGALHDGAARRRFATHEQGDADDDDQPTPAHTTTAGSFAAAWDGSKTGKFKVAEDKKVLENSTGSMRNVTIKIKSDASGLCGLNPGLLKSS